MDLLSSLVLAWTCSWERGEGNRAPSSVSVWLLTAHHPSDLTLKSNRPI